MPRSEALDKFVEAVRERDQKWGQAALSPLFKRDVGQAFVSYTPRGLNEEVLTLNSRASLKRSVSRSTASCEK